MKKLTPTPYGTAQEWIDQNMDEVRAALYAIELHCEGYTNEVAHDIRSAMRTLINASQIKRQRAKSLKDILKQKQRRL